MDKAYKFRLLLEEAMQKEWCASLFCTTCGCLEFRNAIKAGFNRDEILNGLKALDAEFIKSHYIKEALEVIFQDISLFGTWYDLVSDLKGTPVGILLEESLEFKRKSAESREAYKLQHEKFEELQHRNKLDKERAKAQHNIWNALRRTDLKAIESMIAKGIDLNETNEEGKTIKQILTEIHGNH
jgi:hypothetical protein